jgi:hypothetical protein
VPRTRRIRRRRVALWTGVAGVILFALIQAVPYGRDHSNPPVTREPNWDSAQTRAYALRACFDCHSNQTTWRWYSNVAPASWLVQSDVDGGRSEFNFSEWDRRQDVSVADLAESIRGGSMPPWFYVLLHSNAKLSRAEQDAFVRGLDATFAASPPRGG